MPKAIVLEPDLVLLDSRSVYIHPNEGDIIDIHPDSAKAEIKVGNIELVGNDEQLTKGVKVEKPSRAAHLPVNSEPGKETIKANVTPKDKIFTGRRPKTPAAKVKSSIKVKIARKA